LSLNAAVAKHNPVERQDSSVACKGGAVAKPADGYGRAPRLTTAFRCFECGPNTGMRHGRCCSIFLGLPNLQVINRDVHAAKCAIEARDVVPR